MSEFSKRMNHQQYGEVEVCWGFNSSQGEYFLQMYRMEDDVDVETIFAIANYNTIVTHPDFPGQHKFSNTEIAELMQRLECNEQHIQNVLFKIPF